MKIKYEEWSPTPRVKALVDTANRIIDEYQADGYVLTLRQLYYQFVARDIIDNSERSYKNLGNIITKGRMAGLISWEAIEDRNRVHHPQYVQQDDDALISNLPYYVSFDKWANQDTYVEVWVEKEALGNVIERVCKPLGVPHMSCKGYMSSSEMWRAGERFKDKGDKKCVLIHLGDHDPSGIDMTRDNQDRLDVFAGNHNVQVRRIALNMSQVEHFNPPPNPTKMSDSRAKEYVPKYGNESWELDAIEPSDMTKMIEDEVKLYIDQELLEETLIEEQHMIDKLTNLSYKWDDIKGDL